MIVVIGFTHRTWISEEQEQICLLYQSIESCIMIGTYTATKTYIAGGNQYAVFFLV